MVGEKRSREESGGVIEDGDVGSVRSVDQKRGSQEGDTVGGGGDVGEDRCLMVVNTLMRRRILVRTHDDDYADSDDSGDQ